METETAANPAGGDDTRVDTTASDATTPEAIAPAGGTDTTTEAAPEVPELPEVEDDTEEVEVGDKKLRVPKEVAELLAQDKSERLMQKDYTRKTMELADQRRALEERQQRVQQAETLATNERLAIARLDGLNERVAEFEAFDWDTYEQQVEPGEYSRTWRAYQKLLAERQQQASAIQTHFQTKQQLAQQETAKRRAETEAEAAKIIPNWPSRKDEINKFATTTLGYSPEELQSATVTDLRALHLAEIGAKFVERQRAAARAAANGTAKPAPEVGGTASAGVDPKSLSMEQYIAARKAGQI